MFARRVVGLFFAGMAALLGCAALVNYLVDPFMFFRWAEPPRLSIAMQRHSQPGVIRNTTFDTIALGNSTSGNITEAAVSQISVPHGFANFSLNGAYLPELFQSASLAFAKQRIHLVLWMVGNDWSLQGHRYADYPSCMYARTWQYFPYCYLLNADIAHESLAVLFPNLGVNSRAIWRNDFANWNVYGHLPMNVRDNACVNRPLLARLEDFKGRWSAADFTNLDRRSSKVFQAYIQYVISLVDSNSDTKFIFIFPPVYKTELVRDVFGKVEDFLSYMSVVKLEMLPRKNVEVYDFRASELTLDPQHYRDPVHYDSVIVNAMMSAIASGQHRIASVEKNVQEVKTATEEAVGQLKAEYDAAQCP